MALSSGARLGPYEILSLLGAGGMGEVYRARDTRLDRILAVKVLPETLAADPRFRERFDREARTISQITHPNICMLYDVGDEQGTAFLVMEYLEGETLADRLKKGALPVDEARKVAIQIANALGAAHRSGIVHRDLKPGNVMLTKTGAKLVDFGLAKSGTPAVTTQLSVPTTAALTQQGTILGTLPYMAPEQLEGQEADARTDIFAFGAVLYEMVTGKKAFDGKTQASLIAAILEREPPSPSSPQGFVPPALDHLIRRCLSKNPDERWQNASDVSIHLQDVVEGGPSPVIGDGSDISSSNQIIGWRSLSVLLFVLLAGGLVFWRLWRVSAPPTQSFVFTVAPPEGATFVTPGGLPGGLPWLALSPDGRVLAFVALSANGRQQLWARPLAATVAYPLDGTDGAGAPFWSPDSRYIAFFARGKLKFVDAAGGATQVLADAPGMFGSGSWSRDNTIVFAPTPRNNGLQKLQVGGADAGQFVTHLDQNKGQRVHFSPQFLPDGRHFLFGVGRNTDADAETWIGSLDGGEPRLLLRAAAVARYVEPGWLLFKRGSLFAQRVDGSDLRIVGDPIRLTDAAVGSNQLTTYMALSTSMTGTLAYAAPAADDTQLVWRDRRGRTLSSVAVPSASAPSLSPDGTMMVVSRNLPQTGTDLWLYDLKRTTLTRFTFDPALERSPIWSPDGKYVAFAGGRDGGVDWLYRKSTTGSGDEEPIAKMDGSFPTDWSADGRFILFHNPTGDAQRNGWDLWFVSPTDREPKPFVRTPFHEIQGALSPDGRSIAYASDESGAFEVYVQPFQEPGAKRIISNGGGVEPRWRADGRELFYVSADRRLMVVPTTIGATFDVKPTPLFEMNVRDLQFPFMKRYDVARDGQQFVVQELTTGRSPVLITVVANWPALLPKEH